MFAYVTCQFIYMSIDRSELSSTSARLTFACNFATITITSCIYIYRYYYIDFVSVPYTVLYTVYKIFYIFLFFIFFYRLVSMSRVFYRSINPPYQLAFVSLPFISPNHSLVSSSIHQLSLLRRSLNFYDDKK